ncbi:MAG: LapA family protein [Bacteroidia bacterium]|nr:LapA family protein [Bacteroidia bacterium]
MPNQKSDKSLFRLISTLILIGLIVTLALQNSTSQEVKIYFWSFSLPLFVLLFLAFVIGVLLMLVLLYPKYRKADSSDSKILRLEQEITRLEKQVTSNTTESK